MLCVVTYLCRTIMLVAALNRFCYLNGVSVGNVVRISRAFCFCFVVNVAFGTGCQCEVFLRKSSVVGGP